jgi:hypothetical protein
VYLDASFDRRIEHDRVEDTAARAIAPGHAVQPQIARLEREIAEIDGHHADWRAARGDDALEHTPVLEASGPWRWMKWP